MEEVPIVELLFVEFVSAVVPDVVGEGTRKVIKTAKMSKTIAVALPLNNAILLIL